MNATFKIGEKGKGFMSLEELKMDGRLPLHSADLLDILDPTIDVAL